MTPSLKMVAFLCFGPAVRMRLWNKLAMQIRNRTSLEDGLRRLYQQAVDRKSPLAKIYNYILDTLGRGHTLGVALEGLASREEVMLIASAQASAKLAEGFGLAEKVLSAQGRIRNSLISSLSRPIMLFLACVGLLYMISSHVMPQLAMVSDPGSWSGAAHFLHKLAAFVASWGGAASAIVFLLTSVVIALSFSRWTGRLRRFADHLVPWSIYRLTVGTGWLYTVATRMQAGHQLSQILTGMIKEDISPYLHEIVAAILEQSRLGKNFGLSLQDCAMNFPSRDIVDELVIYTSQPGFQDHIMQMANDWLQEGVTSVAALGQKIAFAMTALVIGLLVLVVNVTMNFQSNLQMGGM